MTDEARKHSPHDLLRLIFRRKKLFALAVVILGLAALVGWHFVPVKYTGKTVFEFGLQTGADQLAITGKDAFGTMKERVQQDIAGYDSVEAAATEIGIFEGLPRDEQGELTNEGKAAKSELVQQLASCITIKWEARSKQEDVVSVTFSHRDPRVAERMPNSLVAGYINRTYEKLRQDLKAQHDFVQSRLDESKRMLDELTQRKIKIETANPGLNLENPGTLYEKLTNTRLDLQRRKQDQSLAKLNLDRLKSLQQTTSSAPAAASVKVRKPNPERKVLEDQMGLIRKERQDCFTKGMTASHPNVIAIDQTLAQLEQRLAETPAEIMEETTYGVAPTVPVDLSMAIATAETQIEAATGEIARMETSIVDMEKLWGNISSVRREYLDFVKEWETRTRESTQWQERLRSVEVSLASTVGNRMTHLKAVQSAREQIYPSFPTALIVFGISAAAAMLLAVGLVIVAKMLDRTISSAEHVHMYLGVPVQAVIPEIVTPSQRAMRRLRNWTLGPAVAMLLLGAMGLASMSIYLRLQDPQRYQQWVSSPVDFVNREYCQPALRLMHNPK